MSKEKSGPKVLLFDIETSPIICYTWGIFDQNVGLNQIKQDWHVLSWSAKWLGDSPKKVMYQDQRFVKDVTNDKQLLKGIWDLLDSADIVITQNGKRFDSKKLNARFIMQGFKPPSPYKHIDTLQLAKKYFGFTSNKLEFMTDKLCVKYKKLKHNKFSGFELWKECMAGNLEAWNEMQKYNMYDVLSLEELYNKLAPWGTGINFNAYRDEVATACNCGEPHLQKRGFDYTLSGKYQKFQCVTCGSWTRGKVNLFTKEKRQSLKRGI